MPRVSKKTAPLANRLADALRLAHARADGGIHAGAAGGGCPTCALLREAGAAGLFSGAWPSVIAWDGDTFNG